MLNQVLNKLKHFHSVANLAPRALGFHFIIQKFCLRSITLVVKFRNRFWRIGRLLKYVSGELGQNYLVR